MRSKAHTGWGNSSCTHFSFYEYIKFLSTGKYVNESWILRVIFNVWYEKSIVLFVLLIYRPQYIALFIIFQTNLLSGPCPSSPVLSSQETSWTYPYSLTSVFRPSTQFFKNFYQTLIMWLLHSVHQLKNVYQTLGGHPVCLLFISKV